MKGLSVPPHSYLSELNLACWSSHAFSMHTKSDVLLNNIAEMFNSWVLKARNKLLLSMNEVIRKMLMNLFRSKSEVSRRQSLIFAQEFKKSWEKNKEAGSHFIL